MRKMVAIASLAFGVSLAGAPAFAGSGHLDAWYGQACDEMIAQFDAGAASRQGHANYNQALTLRNQGAQECANVDADMGSEKVRAALQAIGLTPNY